MRAYQEKPIRYRVLRRATSFGFSCLGPAIAAGLALTAVLIVVEQGIGPLSLGLAALAGFGALLAWRSARWFLRSVELTGEAVTLVFAARRVRIPLAEVREAFVAGEDLRQAVQRGALRVSRPRSHLEALGMVDVFAVSHEELVVLRCEGRLPLVLGIEFPHEFVDDLASFAPHVKRL